MSIADLKAKLNEATASVNREVADRLPLDKMNDFEAARKGLTALRCLSALRGRLAAN